MPILIYNSDWMIYNCWLAIIAVVLGILALKSKWRVLKVFFGFFWLLFLPNTIYIFTDLEHLIYQWYHVSPSIRILLSLQYLIFEIIGTVTFFIAFTPFERILHTVHFFKHKETIAIIIFNFLVAFGMVLGRVERINSWEVITQPQKVAISAMNVFLSFDLFGLMILFGLFCNFIYFLFRKKVLAIIKFI